MSFLRSFFPLRSLSPVWTYAPGGGIWRMLPTNDGFLVGESRDEEKKQVRFFCVDLSTGRALWEGKAAGEDWWIGIEAVHGSRVFLHLFARPDMPEHAGIIALDRNSGEVLWRLPNVQFRGALGETLFVRSSADPESKDHPVSAMTGETLTDTTRIDRDAGGITPAFSDPEGIIFPVPLRDGDDGWAAFRNVLGDRPLAGGCEAVRVDDRWIFSYHAAHPRDASLLEHRLAVTDVKGRTLYSDTLHSRAHMPVYDAFFVRDGRVFFIRQERELVCVGLASQKD